MALGLVNYLPYLAKKISVVFTGIFTNMYRDGSMCIGNHVSLKNRSCESKCSSYMQLIGNLKVTKSFWKYLLSIVS